MKSLSLLFPVLFLFVSSVVWASSVHTHEDFLQCISLYPGNTASISKVIFTHENSTYSSVLDYSIRNLRFATSSTPEPLVIVTPTNVSHIQATVICAKKHGLQIRTRSGGHDYEGLSYVSTVPFVILDMINMQSINVNVENKTAWVQVGANIGSLYNRIAEKSSTLSFPAGVCPTVGIGGHFSGGGYGMMMRKYGFAADNIIDAQLVDVNGRFLDRKSMGEDLFWAIRGGGGASFGVIVAWEIKLVSVPEKVTVFTVNRTLEQNATKLVHRWQYVAPEVPDDLFIRLFLRPVNSSDDDGKKTIQASFTTLYLGGVDKLIPLMNEKFPELGSVEDDYIEMSYIQSILYFAGISENETLDILLNRTSTEKAPFKGKSDYVTEPVPESAFEGIWERLLEQEPGKTEVLFSPYGGIMNEIPETAIPFPHRAGNLYNIHYVVVWEEDEGTAASMKYISWIRGLYRYLAPYVSKSPRQAYINYRDLDLGTNSPSGNTSYRQASVWGLKYFNKNFKRLVQVKTVVDPENFFRNEQSIPPVLRG